jgi:hypothetical protein
MGNNTSAPLDILIFSLNGMANRSRIIALTQLGFFCPRPNSFEDLFKHQILWDTPVFAYLEELDLRNRITETTKIIAIKREKESWLESSEKFFSYYHYYSPSPFWSQVRLKLFGKEENIFDIDKFSKVYDSFYSRIEEFKPLYLEYNHSWQPLIQAIKAPYPHVKNKEDRCLTLTNSQH